MQRIQMIAINGGGWAGPGSHPTNTVQKDISAAGSPLCGAVPAMMRRHMQTLWKRVSDDLGAQGEGQKGQQWAIWLTEGFGALLRAAKSPNHSRACRLCSLEWEGLEQKNQLLKPIGHGIDLGQKSQIKLCFCETGRGRCRWKGSKAQKCNGGK